MEVNGKIDGEIHTRRKFAKICQSETPLAGNSFMVEIFLRFLENPLRIETKKLNSSAFKRTFKSFDTFASILSDPKNLKLRLSKELG